MDASGKRGGNSPGDRGEGMREVYGQRLKERKMGGGGFKATERLNGMEWNGMAWRTCVI